MSTPINISFIGGGNMGEAMIAAVLRRGLASHHSVCVSDVSQTRLEYLHGQYGIAVTSENRGAILNKDIVVLAIKPQSLGEVMAGLAGAFQPAQLVLSIIAGARIEKIAAGLHHGCIVRSMPNTPAQIGEGMTVWTATADVSPAQKDTAKSILGAMGKEIYVDDEKYLDMATALSGSGPAYFFLFVESLVAAGVKLGFTPGIARELVLQTMTGSAKLLEQTGKPPEELRRMVTSPGGTTARAVERFEQGNFKELVSEAVQAACERAKELGK